MANKRSRTRRPKQAGVPRPVGLSMAQQPTYRIRRTVKLPTLPVSAADTGFSHFFSPSLITDWSDFSALYDTYRVSGITWKYVVWRAAAPTATGDSFPIMAYATDFNDTVTPVSTTEVLSYGSSRMHVFSEGSGRSASVTYAPKLQQTTPAGTSVLNAQTWARTNITTDNWLGHKVFIENYNSTTYNNTVINLYAVVDLEFKVVK